ncbi:MAG: glycosyltransferase [Candidatus Thermoplasmatota archaeon]|jgi:glycosyltransferase involved in cell wall biosynthesis|nr:glycosyltransferase [Candidatus Thermoplasmatota archaeon]
MSSYRQLPVLSKATAGNNKSKSLPNVSVIIPARNEEKKIGQCIQNFKGQLYPNLEILIVDDHSTDKTVEIAKSIIGNDKRFKILSLEYFKEKKPSGWMGKSYAIQKGSAQVKGEWLLFCDVDDIDYDPELILIAVEFAMARKIDFLSLVPSNVCKSFWEKVIQPIPAGLLIFISPFNKVNDPKNKAAFALGLFILIKKSVFNKIGGYEKIKDRVADDVELAKLVKQSGFKIMLAQAQKMMRFRMYESFKEIWDGWSKNIFMGFVQKREIESKLKQILILLIGLFAVFDTIVLPFLIVIISLLFLMFSQTSIWFTMLIFSLTVWLFSITVQGFVHKKYHIGNSLYAPLYFIGGIITMGIFINSAAKTISGKGVKWKGRTYSQDEIK